MNVTIDRTTTTNARVPSPPARLSLTPAGSMPGLLDRACWPRSRYLSLELPAPMDALDRCWGRITRVTVNPAFWPVVPRKVPVTGHTVHVGWFTDEQDPHKLLLLSYTAGRWDLLVIPPETDAAAAARLMAAAATPGSRLASTRHARHGTRPDQEVNMKSAEPLPSAGHAEVRIVAASPETARQVAEILRRSFATTEQRSYPVGSDGGTRLHLTVDTTHPAYPAPSWLTSGRASEDNRPQADEV